MMDSTIIRNCQDAHLSILSEDPSYPDPAYPDPAYPDPAYPQSYALDRLESAWLLHVLRNLSISLN
jgi:hypothetical protein